MKTIGITNLWNSQVLKPQFFLAEWSAPSVTKFFFLIHLHQICRTGNAYPSVHWSPDRWGLAAEWFCSHSATSPRVPEQFITLPGASAPSGKGKISVWKRTSWQLVLIVLTSLTRFPKCSDATNYDNMYFSLLLWVWKETFVWFVSKISIFASRTHERSFSTQSLRPDKATWNHVFTYFRILEFCLQTCKDGDRAKARSPTGLRLLNVQICIA